MRSWRMRSAAVCALLTALAFVQEPGRITADTKIDLLVNPSGWLTRAMTLWNPVANFGEVQNQAYGYLWPMGPFFAVGQWISLPPWVVQRLWWALLLCVAYTGVVALANRMAIGTPLTRMVAGVAFALCPRILTELGVISSEAWPTAVAPWVLVPLIGLATGSMRRRIAASALLIGLAGGINATATLAAVPLALLWLAMLRPARLRFKALVLWCLAVLCATLWWVGPLLLLSRFSPPFLDYIETSAVTTQPTDLTSVLRGTSHWVAYFGGPHGPPMSAGFRLVFEPLLFAATIAVAVLAVAGLARRGMPHRRFLIAGAMLGMAMLTLGHVSDLDTFHSGVARQFLDGAGAPLRNVHKFDVLLRLPLALGLAHLLGIFDRAAAFSGRGWHLARRRAVVVTGAALAAIGGVAVPALGFGLVPAGSFTEVPGYWRDATGWLNANLGRDHVLVVPGARFPHYMWGSTADEITQPLLDRGWAVRNAIPLAPAGTIRLLDSVEQVLTSGEGSPGLASVLARSGVKYVLLRSDLNYGKTGAGRPALARQALSRSPGLTLVKTFGPMVGADPAEGGFFDYGMNPLSPALEIFEVSQTLDPAGIYPVDSVNTIVGGSESLLELAATGQLSSAPTVLSGDLGTSPPPGGVILTDTLQRRDVSFGRGQDNASATLTADEPVADYLPPWATGHQTVARYSGISQVVASSSWSEAHTFLGARPEHLPYAAVDGDPATSWRAPSESVATEQWLEVTLPVARSVSEVTLTFDRRADNYPSKVQVIGGKERVISDVDRSAPKVTVKLSGLYPTRTIRVLITAVRGTGRASQGSVGIAELEIGDVAASRTLVAPAGPAIDRPATVVLTAAPAANSCVFVEDLVRCYPDLARASADGGRIDREVTLPAAGTYSPAIWARLRPGAELDRIIDEKLAPSVSASSRGIADPAGRAGAVVDGDPSTAWQADVGDGNASLRITWPAPRTITGLRFTLEEGVAGTRPRAVSVASTEGTRDGPLDSQGEIRFAEPLQTSEIVIFFRDPTAPALSRDPYTFAQQVLPIAVGEVTVLPDPDRLPANLDRRVELPCGSGPVLKLGGQTINTRLSATVRELLQLREIPGLPCVPNGQAFRLGPGATSIVATDSPYATPSRIVLTTRAPPSGEASGKIDISRWAPTDRSLKIDSASEERVLVVRENTNPGWQATLAGRALQPLVLDGWQQGWRVPPGMGGTVTLIYRPSTTFAATLAAGGALTVILAFLAILPMRRKSYAHGSNLHTSFAPGVRPSRRRGRALALAAGIAGLAVVGGIWSALAVLVSWLIALGWRRLSWNLSAVDAQRARRFESVAGALLPPLLLALAGLASWRSADRFTDALPQALAVTAVALLWLPAVYPFSAAKQWGYDSKWLPLIRRLWTAPSGLRGESSEWKALPMTTTETEHAWAVTENSAQQRGRHVESSRPGWISRWARRDPLRAVALALIVIQIIWRADIASRGFLAADDYVLVRRTLGVELDAHLLTSPWNDHLMPGGMLIYWLVANSAGYAYWPYVLIMLFCQAVLSIAFYRLLRSQFGARWAILVPLCLVMFSPLTLETTTWWAVGAAVLPMEIAMVFAIGAQMKYARTRRARHLVSLGLSLVFGLLFFEKTLLVSALLFFLTACFFVDGGPIRSVALTLVRYWRAWLVIAVVSVGHLFFYAATNAPSPPLPSTIRSGVDFLQSYILRTFVPGIIGGPWSWLPNGDSPPFTGAQTLPSLAALTVVAAFIGVTAWRRPIATRAWILLGLYLAMTAGLFLVTRAGMSPVNGLLTRFLADAVIVAALCVGVALMGLHHGTDLGKVRPWPLPGLLREPGATAVGLVISMVAIAALGIGAAWSAEQYGQAWAVKTGRDYLVNIRADLAKAPADTVFFDSFVPPDLLSPLTYPENKQSIFLSHLDPGPKFVRETTKVYTIDKTGHIHPAKVEGFVTVPGSETGCGWRISGSSVAQIPLVKPAFEWDWAVRVGYLASAPTSVTMRLGHGEHKFQADKGLQEIFFLLDGAGGNYIELTIADPTVTICLDSIEVGVLAPK
ncbi:hypothetical protein Rhe02_43360 [Rhizocola hellebori]|uniref:DUF3367 domain-containing protein n=1 Tax=Rhizocola hellebori TaxID=1392758 RepID=A0A8J3Q902_9ACTN|nr:alpha-(1->3)-arabinofuranosyltransferase [Rhizocola hellebori]GIH06269.1 hypothetical protein Rhe02_43360 [Rhizocola hellebori]